MSTATTAPDDELVVDDRPSGFFHSRTWLYGEMLVGAIISLVAAFVLSHEAVVLAGNDAATFSCDFGAVFSCSKVALSWQASLFGFPNSFLGLAAEPVVITLAVLGLAGMRFPRWFMIAAQTIYLFGFVFAYWLFFEAVFSIGALCIWCLTVQLSTTVVFFSMLHLNILDDNLRWPRPVQRFAMSMVRSGGLGFLLAAWLIATVAVVVFKYGANLIG
ncbi:MAG: vitamin K epoxide reductase family protein [Promicromonosporaceae bacterium]|nr:vitamin K epoxide reductase family protein [Promicromonosporaceae bacterium]